MLLPDVKSPTYLSGISLIPYLSVNASRDTSRGKAYLMVINKSMDKEVATTISVKSFVPTDKGESWVLNGPTVAATNEKDHDAVAIRHQSFQITGASFKYSFEPHSLTAIEIDVKHKE